MPVDLLPSPLSFPLSPAMGKLAVPADALSRAFNREERVEELGRGVEERLKSWREEAKSLFAGMNNYEVLQVRIGKIERGNEDFGSKLRKSFRKQTDQHTNRRPMIANVTNLKSE